MRSSRTGKTALVLAGGGLTGAVYEIGALRAIDDLLVDRSVNDFDIYVGTSAGSLVSSLLANGISPEEMLKAIEGTHLGVQPLERGDLFGLNYRDLISAGWKLPRILLESGSYYLRNQQDLTIFDFLWSLSSALPAGFYDGLALERYLRQAFKKLECSNQFDALARDLFIIATQLDNGERAVFSRESNKEVPITMAVAASSALPVLYKPVRIGEHEYVDGGLRGNASLDVAIEHGATLVVCINPLVPYSSGEREPGSGKRKSIRHLSEKGVQSVTNQTLRITTHAGLQYHIKQLRRSHPEVDIILIEPSPEDYKMFFYNIMRYSARLTVARHGFESATLDLAEDYNLYKQVLARHSIPITRRLVIEQIAEIRASNNDPEVIRRVLEARSSACSHRRRGSPVCQLTRTLAELEMALDSMSAG